VDVRYCVDEKQCSRERREVEFRVWMKNIVLEGEGRLRCVDEKQHCSGGGGEIEVC